MDLEYINVYYERRVHNFDDLNEDERTLTVNWAAQQTRQDMSFAVMKLSMKFKNFQLETLPE